MGWPPHRVSRRANLLPAGASPVQRPDLVALARPRHRGAATNPPPKPCPCRGAGGRARELRRRADGGWPGAFRCDGICARNK